MVTVLIEQRKPLLNTFLRKILDTYNEGLDEPLYLEAVEKSSCFSISIHYKFYKAVGDMPNHYIEGNVLTERETFDYLSYKLNEKQNVQNNFHSYSEYSFAD